MLINFELVQFTIHDIKISSHYVAFFLTAVVAAGDKLNDENALSLVGGDEEMDMLADVKQMAAAAAAAGQESWSFENQLRPIDRYAMRFLDLWDPIVDRSRVEETAEALEEWELERIERMKDELEAEIDEDQEPLQYESMC